MEQEKPIFENEKLKILKGSKEKTPKGIIEIDTERKRMFQTRIYPLNETEALKILSTQDLKTGQIEATAILQIGDEKVILGRRIFQDENDYGKNIKSLELELSLNCPINPEKVLITTAEEFEKIFNQLKNAKEKEIQK